ncbi:hypothetical protein GCM10028786_26820 [Flaviaesturariibacter terrae]
MGDYRKRAKLPDRDICLYGFSDDSAGCEIGYELLPGFQGKGIMREALEKVINYAFHTLNVQKIDAFFHRENKRSQKLLETFSFRGPDNTDGTSDADVLHYHLDKPANHS